MLNLILKTIEKFGNQGVTEEEFLMAKNLLFASSVELFESNAQMAYTFLFLKKFKLSFDWAWLQDYYYSLYNSRPWLESV